MISSKQSIPKRPLTESSDFEELRLEGVRLIERLSGERWTDYNLHDPGITILEQLCYGLTDLLHRMRFQVPDHLASPDGSIAFEEQALHPPEEAFPSRPTTLDDYRRAVMGKVRGVENVWIHRVGAPGDDESSPGGIGVHRVRIHLGSDVGDREEICAQVRQVFMKTRNLGEDVDLDIRVLEERHCILRGAIEVRGGRPPEEILAEVYSRCKRHVAGDFDPATGEFRVSREATERLKPEGGGGSLEGFLSGPFLERETPAGSLVSGRSQVHIADLVSVIRDVEGVTSVDRLWLDLEGEDEPELNSAPRWIREEDQVLCLRAPGEGLDDQGVDLTRMGRTVAVVDSLLRHKYRELKGAQRLARHGRTQLPARYAEPTGSNRDDDRYHSIQDDFPDVYGVNSLGLPASASPEDRARVAQLKAFLLPMEQLLANQMADIRHLRDLFSTADASTPTYRYQVLGDEEVPEVTPLYREDPAGVLAKLYGEMNRVGAERSRALDYMLALYGESLNQRSLRQFDHYGAERMDQIVIQNKIDYLRSVVAVGRDRGGSFDYALPYWKAGGGGEDGANVSGFHLRVGLLLGLRRPGGRSLVEALSGLQVEEATESSGGGGRAGLTQVEIDGSYAPVPLMPVEPSLSLKVPGGILPDALFVRGTKLDAFRLGRRGTRSVLVFRSSDDGRWLRLGDYPTEARGVEVANALRRYLIELNVESEGFHVLEHILLRPEQGRGEHTGLPESERLWTDFYPLRVSIFFSGWTARSRDEGFRLLAAETVRLNAPAHIQATCYWLELGQMREFETHFGAWLQAKADPTASAESRDVLAAELIRFVRAREKG